MTPTLTTNSSSPTVATTYKAVVQPLTARVMDSPIGRLTLIAQPDALIRLTWGESLGLSAQGPLDSASHPILDAATAQLQEYFLGRRRSFEVPIKLMGTDFQLRTWRELQQIPYGEFITYKEQAFRLGQPAAVRAVGAANGRNPIGIIIPCHRVIGASGHLTGFAGGLDIKRRLLEIEGLKVDARMIRQST